MPRACHSEFESPDAREQARNAEHPPLAFRSRSPPRSANLEWERLLDEGGIQGAKLFYARHRAKVRRQSDRPPSSPALRSLRP